MSEPRPFLSYHYEYDEDGNQSAPIIDTDDLGLASRLTTPPSPPPELVLDERRVDAASEAIGRLAESGENWVWSWGDIRDDAYPVFARVAIIAYLATTAALSDEGRTWSCPDCAFTFDACHTDSVGDGYSCPACAEWKMRGLLRDARDLLWHGRFEPTIGVERHIPDCPGCALESRIDAALDSTHSGPAEPHVYVDSGVWGSCGLCHEHPADERHIAAHSGPAEGEA